MTMPAPADTMVIRPTPAALRRAYLQALLPLIPLTFVVLINSIGTRSGGPVFLLIWLVVVVLVVAFLIWYTRVTRVEFGGGRYLYATTFVRREFTIADIERLIAVDEVHYGLQGARMLFVVGRTNRRLLRLNSVMFDTAQVEWIINDLIARGVPLGHMRGRVTPGEFDRLEPGLMRWIEVHRVAFAIILVVGILVLMAIVITVVVALLTAR